MFVAEFYDPQADLVRPYRLKYHPDDSSVELYDLKNRRTFLKRVHYPSINTQQLRIGGVVSVYNRQLTITELADAHTSRELGRNGETALAVVTAHAYESMGRVVDAAVAAGFSVGRARLVRLGLRAASALRSAAGEGAAEVAAGPALAFEVVGKGSVAWWATAARGGLPAAGVRPGGLLSAATAEEAAADADLLFDAAAVPTAPQFEEGASSVLVVRPHAYAEGLLGKIVDAVLEDGHEITSLETFQLDQAAAAEFLEVYNGVAPEYHAAVAELSSGTCVAMELRAGAGAVQTVRDLCGPPDPEIARRIRPKSLRARFGSEKVTNAVHCTDLAEDASLESEFFFTVLQGA